MATAPAHRDEARPVAHNIAKLPVLVRPAPRQLASTSASHPTPDISLHRTNRRNFWDISRSGGSWRLWNTPCALLDLKDQQAKKIKPAITNQSAM